MKLYHYTDQNGFMGILGARELWATKIQYLNDNNEYNLAFSIAISYLNKLLIKKVDDNVRFRLKRMIANIDSVSNKNICVCSLSEEGDLLSQWRGYSNVLGGYSIAFDKDELSECLSRQGFDLRPCIYEKKEQEKILINAIDEVLEEFKDFQEPNQNSHHPSSHTFSSDSSIKFWEVISKISPFIKDSHFSEEKEWRIVSKNGISFSNLEFRPGKSMLTPYFKILLNGINFQPIKEIIVGHTPHLELAKNATQAFIYKNFPVQSERPFVRSSQIPFRNW